MNEAVRMTYSSLVAVKCKVKSHKRCKYIDHKLVVQQIYGQQLSLDFLAMTSPSPHNMSLAVFL